LNENYLSFNNNFSLNEKTVLVTGAAGQIGSGIVSGCLAAGANVIASDVNLADLENAVKRWEWPESRIDTVSCDIRQREQVLNLLNVGIEKFGKIDSLVNNAGVSVFEPFLERNEEDFDLVMDVNLKGTFFCIQEFTKYISSQSIKGEIVNIASHYGIVSPDPRIYTDCDRKNSEVYGATKAGIIQMTRYFSVHLAQHKIRINSVAPGGVRNPDSPQGEDFQKNYSYRCPLGRMAETNEIVGPVIFLLSPVASYINGQTLVVDGGSTAW
jgi:NAD(P)-dependent dehydrogenase (short-subunit alcohol dehydrogenase family)